MGVLFHIFSTGTVLGCGIAFGYFFRVPVAQPYDKFYTFTICPTNSESPDLSVHWCSLNRTVYMKKKDMGWVFFLSNFTEALETNEYEQHVFFVEK